MSDPAVEAAQRAFWVPGESHEIAAVAAAREALKPIRDLLDKLALDTYPPCDLGTRIDLFQQAISDLSPLVYTTEELANG